MARIRRLHAPPRDVAPPHQRRGEVLEDAILRAAWDVLKTRGYANTTMEAIAAKAQTSKTALYRRWHSRAELIITAIRRFAPMLSGESPDTGSLRGDVLALLRRVTVRTAAIGRDTLFGLIVEAYSYTDSEAFQLGRQAGRDAMMAILGHAARRGEICLEKVTDRMASLPVDLLRSELMLTTNWPILDSTLDQIVDTIFLPFVGACASDRPVDRLGG